MIIFKPLILIYSYNPGRIDPTNGAWNASRKPLVAAWETISGDRFFTINLQLTSKLGSSSTQGDARSPVNAGSDQRTSQVGAISVGEMTASYWQKETNSNYRHLWEQSWRRTQMLML